MKSKLCKCGEMKPSFFDWTLFILIVIVGIFR